LELVGSERRNVERNRLKSGDVKHKEVTDPSEMSGTTYLVTQHHISKEQKTRRQSGEISKCSRSNIYANSLKNDERMVH
jgi:hypothetical protein